MKITTKSRYGLRAMIEVAKNDKKNIRTTLHMISDGEEVSENYLEQIFASLKKGGLVKSTRGVKGGYNLAKAASEISVGDILRILEAPVEIVDCIRLGTCKNKNDCIASNIWKDIFQKMMNEADNITLEYILKEEGNKDGN